MNNKLICTDNKVVSFAISKNWTGDIIKYELHLHLACLGRRSMCYWEASQGQPQSSLPGRRHPRATPSGLGHWSWQRLWLRATPWPTSGTGVGHHRSPQCQVTLARSPTPRWPPRMGPSWKTWLRGNGYTRGRGMEVRHVRCLGWLCPSITWRRGSKHMSYMLHAWHTSRKERWNSKRSWNNTNMQMSL